MKQFSLEEYLADPNRKVVTRNGKSVRIKCTDRKCVDYPIIALIDLNEIEDFYAFSKDGECWIGEETKYDLFFAPEKKEGWANIYLCEGEYSLDDVIYSSRACAEESGKKFEDYLTTIQIEWEE